VGEQTFAERLKALRAKADFSVSDLARVVRVSEGAIRLLESGRSKDPRFSVGVRLARVLGVSASYLLDGRGARSTETGSRSLVEIVMAQEHQDMQIAALSRRVSRLEARAGGAPPRTARE
jgi:transcriptional regulator with XRE-family HTH domain